jgi:hypothetical protein
MARQPQPPTQPNTATPSSQPLVTPSAGALPTEMVFLLSQQQAQQTLNAEVARLGRENGALRADLDNLKASLTSCSDDTASIKKQHQFFLGGASVIGVALAILAYFFSAKIAVLMTLADERQVHDSSHATEDATKNAGKAGQNSN